jgi:hypothetical protein
LIITRNNNCHAPNFVVFNAGICLPLSEYCKHHPATHSYYSKNKLLPRIDNIKLEEDGVTVVHNEMESTRVYTLNAYEEIYDCLNRYHLDDKIAFLKAEHILLSTDQNTQKKVFELFSKEQQKEIKSHRSWPNLLAHLNISLSKSKTTKEDFEAQWDLIPYEYVDKTLEDFLYAWYEENYHSTNSLIQTPRHEKISKILNKFGILTSKVEKIDGRYRVTLDNPNDGGFKIGKIRAAAKKNNLYLTGDMAGSLYNEVKKPIYLGEHGLVETDSITRRLHAQSTIIITLQKLLPDTEIDYVDETNNFTYPLVDGEPPPNVVRITPAAREDEYTIQSSADNLDVIKQIYHQFCTREFSINDIQQLMAFAIHKNPSLENQLSILTIDTIKLGLEAIDYFVYTSVQQVGHQYFITCNTAYYDQLKIDIQKFPPHPSKIPAELPIMNSDLPNPEDEELKRKSFSSITTAVGTEPQPTKPNSCEPECDINDIHKLIENNEIERIKKLIEKNVQLLTKKTDVDGLSLLHIIIKHANSNATLTNLAIFILNTYDIDLLSKNNNNSTILHYAVHYKNQPVINKIVTQSNQDQLRQLLSIKNNAGNTPLSLDVNSDLVDCEKVAQLIYEDPIRYRMREIMEKILNYIV